MFHQRTVKTLVMILLVPLMVIGGFMGYLAGLFIGVVAWMLIEKLMPRPAWYDHEDEKAGFTRLDLKSPAQALPQSTKESTQIGDE
jgi:hypothetical protein